ncbi:uncharacterized protein [Dermacentor albipictus]|uniref:uncharacterized protein isoform X2 n=1 Tax=Dermacentor albipictus TaxID=60249 RepID=UPI0038FCC880
MRCREDLSGSRKDKQGIFKDLVTAMPILLVLVVFALVITLRHFRTLKGEYKPDALRAQEAHVCDGKDCARVFDMLLEASNATINPCYDFYSHVCGLWSIKVPGRPSYAIENRRNLTERLHHQLVEVLRSPSLCAQREYEMARFYDSCHAFVRARRRPSVRGTLAKANIDVDAWLRCATLQDLMSVVIETSLRTGLPSLVTAFSISSEVGIEPGSTIANSLRDNSGNTAVAYIERALRELDLRNDTKLWLFLQTVDGELGKIGHEFNRTYPFRKISIRDLESPLPGFSWIEAFRHVFYNGTTLSSESLIRIRGYEQVTATMKAIRADLFIFANIYALLLALAQLAKYEYILPSSNAHNLHVAVSCLEVTGQYFPTLLAAWVAQTLALPSSTDYVQEMLSVFGLLRYRTPPISDKINVSSADVLGQRVAVIGAPEGGIARCSRNAPVIYTNDFLRNVILAAKGEEPSSPEVRDWAQSIAQHQLDGAVTVDIGTNTLLLPALYLTGDLLHPEASEPFLDYSTVGVRVLVEWVHMLLSRRPESPEVVSYEQCVLDSAREYVADNVSDSSLREMLFIPWALDLALVGALYRPHQRSLQPLDGKKRAQLFFRRFCQTLCGDDEGAKVCAYAALQSHEFSVAFDCPRTLTISC